MRRPNFVFILIDDLGWRDLGCYGSSFYETPHLDRLAAEGMRFTDAYAACPVCSPTRASLLTGRYPARLGLTDWIDNAGRLHPLRGRLVDVPYLKELRHSEPCVATSLRAAGYQTWHVGKWHLGGEPYYPETHGFERNVGGCDWGSPRHGYLSPWGLPNLPDGPAGEYLTDRLTDEAIRLLGDRDTDRPFFLNFWHYAVHIPIQAREDCVAKYRDKARALRLDQTTPFVEGEPFPTLNRRGARVQRRVVQSDVVYAAMVENLDTNVGRLLAALDEAGLADDTVVMFTSDNGGLATAEGSPTCNHPLQDGKGWMYEGGTREPFLVRWPGHVRAGSVCQTPITSPDLYPTLLELAGLPPEPEHHLDGVSFAPLLAECGPPDREAIFWHYPHYGNQGGTPGCSVRIGDYKLIEFFEDGRLELYNLREDIAEAVNLVERMPALASQMHERLVAWRTAIGALRPAPNPDVEPAT